MTLEDIKKQKVRTLIIDADVTSLREVSRLVMNNPQMELVNTSKTGRSAINALKESPVDLVIMNPALPDSNGFDIMAALPDPPVIVIVSDRPDYAYYGYRIDAVDYRLKPITADLVQGALQRVQQRMYLRALLNQK